MDTKFLLNAVSNYARGQGHYAIIPNWYLLKGIEIDVFSIKGKNIYDFEVKISRGDFVRDGKKGKHGLIKRGRYPANFFYYVCPAGMIKRAEVPDYAGLLWVNDKGYVRQRKAAKRLRGHSPERYFERIARKLERAKV